MLENKCPRCGHYLDTGFNCPVCSKKTIMKTPTKEQIDNIIPLVKRQFEKTKNIWVATKTAILEWEKIRS